MERSEGERILRENEKIESELLEPYSYIVLDRFRDSSISF